ncbi:MAG: peptidylprolyl isomerase [Planctomycetaceae bacterium]
MSPRPAPARPRVVACLVLAAAAHAGGASADPAPTDVVVTVGTTPIFRSELDAVMRRAPGGAEPSAPEAATGPSRRQLLEAVAIEQLVDQRLLRGEIERERITVARTEIEGRLDQLKKQVAARGGEWPRFLEQMGRDENAIREQIGLELALDRLLRPKLTPAVIAAGFETHRREIDGTRLRVSHIVIRPDAALGDDGHAAAVARATAIRREIIQGAVTFADAAARHSAGPSRARGGDLGWITRDAPMIDAFTKQAFALSKGDVSKPFMTPFGIHIVQVTAIEPGRAGLDALRPKLETLLAGTMLRDLLTRLRASKPVVYTPGVAHFDPATPADGPAPRRIVVGDAAVAGPPGP